MIDSILSSVINKLPTGNSGQPILLSGDRVNASLQAIRALNTKYSLDLSLEQLNGLAILLQNVNPSIFTSTELIRLARLPLYYFENINFPYSSIRKIIDPSNPLYDTGSNRLYKLIDVNAVSADTLRLSLASFNTYNVNSLTQIIIALDNVA